MKRVVYLLIAVSLIVGLLPLAAFAHTEDEPYCTDLIAGGGNVKSQVDAGDVCVWNDGDNLYVEYMTHEPWCLLRTELHVGDELADIPHNKNSHPKMGEFEFITDYELEPCVTEEIYQISLVDHDLQCSDKAFIAAHAVVVDLTSETTEVIVSEAGLDVYGPLPAYAPLDGMAWGDLKTAVATWVHPSWPSIPDASWISTAYYTEEPVNDSWRWFQDEIPLPEKGYYLSGSVVLVTSDNAEEAYHNGTLIGSDGEVQGLFTDDWEWQTIVEYPFAPAKGLNTFDFIVRNYAQAGGSPTSNPTGLIYKITATYYREETGWGFGERFRDKNWAMHIEYTVQCPVCPPISDMSDNIEPVSPPTDVSVGEYESDDDVRIWQEFLGPLPAALEYDLQEGRGARADGPNSVSPQIAAGEYVCSYYVHLDNVGDGPFLEHSGSVEFDTNVLGLIISGGNIGDFAGRDLMFAADGNIGNPGTTYPDTSGVNYLRGFDVNWYGNLDDAVFSGGTVNFTMWVIEAHDSFRIILPALWQ